MIFLNFPRKFPHGVVAALIFFVFSAANYAQQLPSAQATNPPAAKQATNESLLSVAVSDAHQRPIVGANCALYKAEDLNNPIAVAQTDERGRAEFKDVAEGVYALRVVKEGFETFTKGDVSVGGATREVAATLAVGAVSTDVTVTASSQLETSVEAGATTPTGTVNRETAKRLPLASALVTEALPLVPGVVRSPKGELGIKGANEQQSALIVNGVHANDPATGNFRLNLPVDSVEAVQVFQHPYTAEYGRFIGGVTQVETRRGGDKFHFELNDFLPDFRFKGGKLVGVEEDNPRINFNGPLIGNKLFFSQSLAYSIAKRPVRGLTFPDNETKTETQSYFTQLDWLLSDKHTQAFTFGYAPERDSYLGLNFFQPRPVTANYKHKDFVATIRDNYALGEGLLQSTFSYKVFDANVWGQGTAEQTFAPTGETGNYFATQDRRASRFEAFEVYQFPIKKYITGAHEIKVGFDFIRVGSRALFEVRPVNILRADGTRAERIFFDERAPREIRVNNHELSGFAQDRWAARQNLSFDFGVRYEDQHIASQQNFAPRAGFAWSPFKGDKTVVRGGVGVFYDKVPLNIRGFSNYPARVITTYDADGKTILGRHRFPNLLVDVAPITPLDFRHPKAGSGFVPQNVTWNIEATHQLTPKILLRANYIDSNTNDTYIVNPELDYKGKTALVLRSAGVAEYRAFELTGRYSLPQSNAIYVSYVRSRARGDLNDFNSYFGDASAPIVRQNQFGTLPFDVPNRFLAWGTIALPRRITLAPIIEARTGFPYSILDETQNFIGERNGVRYPRFFSFDMEASKDFQLTQKYGLRISVRGYNLTNHFNPQNVHANIADPLYGVFFASQGRTFSGGFDILF